MVIHPICSGIKDTVKTIKMEEVNNGRKNVSKTNEETDKSNFSIGLKHKISWGKFWWIVLIPIFLLTLFAFRKNIFPREKEPKDQKKQINQEVIVEDVIKIDSDNPPKFIQADFVELDKVYSISKFRSGMGHDYSILSGETCRGMKHYFSAMDSEQPIYKYEGFTNENTPLPTLEKDVKIFSPVDGTLIIDPNELIIHPDSYPAVAIRLQHVAPVPNKKAGKVMAGETIGLVLANQSFDLALDYDTHDDKGEKMVKYISYFAALPEDLFAKYQARGVRTRDDLIISREYRDAHPYSCHGEGVFDKYYLQIEPPEANRVFLSGYAEIQKKIDAKYPSPDIVETRDTDTY